MSSPKAKHCNFFDEVVDSRDRISALPNDLLIQILLLVSTKDAVATMVLSKRWRLLWTIVPKLEYKYTDDYEECESDWKFLEKSLELHKAPFLETLCIQIGKKTTVKGDARRWVSKAVDRLARKLVLELFWSAEPTRLPRSLYTSKTLVELTLANKVLVDVPSSACLPCIKILRLIFVVYKDEDSLVRLLQSCSVLVRSKVWLGIFDSGIHPAPTRNLFHCVKPHIYVFCRVHDKFLKSMSLVTDLCLALKDPKALSFSGNTFSTLEQFILQPFGDFWFGLIQLILSKSPKLHHLYIRRTRGHRPGNLPLSWNNPSFVPSCLSSSLELFYWYDYSGSEEEKQLMRCIITHSKCLKEVKITLAFTLNLVEKEVMLKELKSLSRASFNIV